MRAARLSPIAAALGLTLAAPARADERGPGLGARAPEAVSLAIGLAPGYAFRPHRDDRSHGTSAALSLDVPLLPPWGLRLTGLGLAFGESEHEATPLGFGALSLSLLYTVDDGDGGALFEIGPLGGSGGAFGEAAEPWGLYAGALFGLGLRFPLADALSIEATARAPYLVYGPDGIALPPPLGGDPGQALFPLLLSVSVGVTVQPLALWEASVAGAPWQALLPRL